MNVQISKLSISLVVLVLALGTLADGNYDLHFIPWGGKCKVPKDGEFLLPKEECDESKGIICQSYSQGDYCGCGIKSQVSYDRASGECRRRPIHHCTWVNLTEHPNAYKALPRQVKCHEDAVCVKQTIEENGKKSEITNCLCKRGYILSRDKLECLNVNSSQGQRSNLFVGISALLFVIFANKYFNLNSTL